MLDDKLLNELYDANALFLFQSKFITVPIYVFSEMNTHGSGKSKNCRYDVNHE